MKHFQEWVCETQVEYMISVSRLSRNSALKRAISGIGLVSVISRRLNWWRVFSDWKVSVFLFPKSMWEAFLNQIQKTYAIICVRYGVFRRQIEGCSFKERRG